MNLSTYCPFLHYGHRLALFLIYTRIMPRCEKIFFYWTLRGNCVATKFLSVRWLTNASFYRCLMPLSTSNLLQTKAFQVCTGMDLQKTPPLHQSTKLICILSWTRPKRPATILYFSSKMIPFFLTSLAKSSEGKNKGVWPEGLSIFHIFDEIVRMILVFLFSHIMI
jgi:hypothetical protein